MYERRHSMGRGPRSLLLAAFTWAVFVGPMRAEPSLTTGIRIKHVYQDSVYLEAGSSIGLAEGQTLTIKRKDSQDDTPIVVAEIQIESVAPMSAAGRIVFSKIEIVPGDVAFLSREGLQQVRHEMSAREVQRYAQVVSFTEGIPPEQEVRDNIPRPPLPEVNRIRGRIGVDYSALDISGSGIGSSQFGFMLRVDAKRLGGTHWSASGYYRGRVQSTKNPVQQETLTDLINRTYHLSINYDNPASSWVAGAGRLYVPWASSLSTIDGFYAGRRMGKETVGLFFGTTPDPSSWNYDPHRQLGGVFVNTERGSWESFRITSTAGIALSRVHWKQDRQFGFFENGIYYKHYVSIYSDVETDLLTASQTGGKREVKLSRSYFTLRLQPHKVISFDVSDNYFRNVPTFDVRLIGTGLEDRFLWQGLNGGIRLTLPYHLSLYGNTGRSSRTNDQRPSWNYLTGASLADILHSGVRAEYRYSKFDSSFGKGTYQSFTVDRELGEGLRFQIQAGQQDITSIYTSQSRARFINGDVDYYLGLHYFMGAGVTVYRGQVQTYNQYFVNFGYRFDNRR